MRITRSRRLKANLGNYESFEFGGSVTVDHHDFGFTDESLTSLSEDALDALTEDINTYAEQMISAIMREEISTAAGMTVEQKSVLHQIVDPPTSSHQKKR